MKKYLIIIVIHFISFIYSQTIPNLPIPICAGTAEVLGDSIYFFGGANRWAGTIRYPTVYRFDGGNWMLYDSIPDDNVWGMESVIVDSDVYLLAGWRNGANNIRKYNLLNKSWSYLTPSPNFIHYGVTAEYVNNHIYLFSTNGNVFEYNLTNDFWQAKTSKVLPSFSLSSAVYQDEIYIIGFYDSTFSHPFYKYNPATDTWVQLAGIPYQVSKCAMNVINDKIYCAGGSVQGSPSIQFDSLLVYDIFSDSWSIDQFELSGKRLWMADVIYNNRFLVLGGFDSTSFAVDIVEEIVPEGVIPVELYSFNASVIGSDVKLTWITATELNNKGFELFRNGNKIAFIEGRGTTTEKYEYYYEDINLLPGIFNYRLEQLDFDGTRSFSSEVAVHIFIPEVFSLEQNYPNPFNPSTKISWQSPVSSWHTLKVYDVLGNEVANLIDELKPAGSYEVDFDAFNLSSGIYFYQLKIGSYLGIKKMILLK